MSRGSHREERRYPCQCNGGEPTRHTLQVQKNGSGVVIARAFYCTNCGTRKSPPADAI